MLGLSAGIVAIYAVFFSIFWGNSGPRDGDQFLVFHTLQYWNAALFGLAKQWTPLMCAGLSMAGEPQIPFMSLSMVLSYASNPLIGVRLATIAYLVFGFTGAYLYAGLWLATRTEKILAACLFVGNGFFFCRIAFGHFDFIPFLTLPLILWTLHRSVSIGRWADRIVSTLLLGAGVALIIDGSPVVVVHLLFWIGVYAVVLAVNERSAIPLWMLGFACVLATLLDAGYLWPMIRAQATFPRRTVDAFTSALSLIWFAVLPLRGKVLPANGNGHELTVFIGPVLACCLWRSRHWLARDFPTSLGRPLLVVCALSILLGMGSLAPLHVPTWLSLFDMLRTLPGFRSIGVTGRYWGFLALPLSLLSAAALVRCASELPAGSRRHLLLGSVVLIQLGFQAESLATPWRGSPSFKPVSPAGYFSQPAEEVGYVEVADPHLQGELLSPTRGVSNCYDMDDFTHAVVLPGAALVASVREGSHAPAWSAHANFINWSHIRVQMDCGTNGRTSCGTSGDKPTQLVLQQAYHPLWHTNACRTLAGPGGNLTLECHPDELTRSPIELEFFDPVSARAAQTSVVTWAIWGLSVLCAGGCRIAGRRRWPEPLASR